MKVILEKEEVLAILGEHFGTVLDPDKVTIKTVPQLEIELTGIALSNVEGRERPLKKETAVVEASAESIEDVLKESEALKRSTAGTIQSVPNNSHDEVD